MSIVDEPKRFGSFAELDAWLDVQLAAAEVSELPVVLASSGLCPGCGAPVAPDGPEAPTGMTSAQLIKAGRRDCLCPACGFPVRRRKRGRTDAPTCRYCARPVPEADDEALVVTCALCVSHRADLKRLGLLREDKAERVCPDCGEERAKYAQRCPGCAEKHRRKKARDRQRRRRAGGGVGVSRFSENEPFADKGLQQRFPRGGVVPGHLADSGAQKRDREVAET